MILAIYLTGLFVTLCMDISVDVATNDWKFNIKWILSLIFSFLFWPFVAPMNVIMSIYLRSKKGPLFYIKK